MHVVGLKTDPRNSSLEKLNPQHHFLTDLAEKSDLFDKAAIKYKAKVAV